MQRYVVEFLGTFFLVLTIGLVVRSGTAGPAAALAIGSALMGMVYAGCHVSGAHYNPAVTLAVWICGRTAGRDVPGYIGAQLLAAVAAAVAVGSLVGDVQPVTPAQLEAGRALVAEFLFTFALVWVVLNTTAADATAGNSYYGLAIGFTVAAGTYAMGAIPGAAFNPAVAVGLAAMALSTWGDIWIFIAATLPGGALAAVAFRVLVAERARRRVMKRLQTVVGCVMVMIAPASGHTQELRDVYRRVRDAVVVVHTAGRQVERTTPGQFVSVEGIGSGVLIGDRQVLTAAHVVQTADEIVVELVSGETLTARVVASEPTADVALLELARRPTRVVPAPLGDSDSVRVGDPVFVVGAPFGVTHTLTAGYISARRRPDRTLGGMVQAEFLQTDAAINKGNSGGPLFSMAGEVIGVVSFIVSQSGGYEGLGFAVTSNVARALVIEQRSLWSGMEGVLLTDGLAHIFNIPPPEIGLLVQRVAKGSPAERLGIRAGTVHATIAGEEILLGGDIVVSFQGVRLEGPESFARFRELGAALRVRDTIRVTVLRAGQTVELTAPVQP